MGQTTSADDWAKKVILDRIAKATESSAESLQDMLNSSSRGLRSLETATTQSASSTRASSQAQREAAERSKGLGKAFGDLYTTLKNGQLERERSGRAAREFGTSLSDSGAMFRSATQRVTTAVSSLPLLGPIIGVGIGAISGFVSQLLSTRDTFINVVDSGIMFDGSISGFRVAVGNAGLTAEQFGALVEQSGQAIKLFGENKFLDSTLRLRSTFDALGISITQGNEYFAEYLENSRLSSNLYFRTEEEHRLGFEDNLKLMREQARLTGVSVRQQRDQQRALAQSLEYQVMIRSLSPARRQYIESQRAAILPAAGADFANEFFTFVQTRAPKSGGFLQALQTLGGGQQIQALAERARRGEQLSIEDFQNAIVAIPERVFGQALAQLRGSNPELVARLMDVRMPAEAAVRARAIARGETPPPSALAPEVEALTAAQAAVQIALSQFQSAITSFGATLLRAVTPQILTLTNVMREFNNAPSMDVALQNLQASGTLSESINKIIESYRTGGMFSAALTGLREGAKAVGSLIWEGMEEGWKLIKTYFTEWKNSFLEGITNWSSMFIERLQALPIIRWFGDRRSENPAPTPEESRANLARNTADNSDVYVPMLNPLSERIGLPTNQSLLSLNNPRVVQAPPIPNAQASVPGNTTIPNAQAGATVNNNLATLAADTNRVMSELVALMKEGNTHSAQIQSILDSSARATVDALSRMW
jgi:hypothetical protein